VTRWRSKDVLKRPKWSMQRALYKSMGYSDYDLERPLVGIANSWNRIVPGHYNLNLVSDYVRQGILQAGGTPVEFGVIAACDGIAQGHDGMHYILPTRDLIANDVEMMVGELPVTLHDFVARHGHHDRDAVGRGGFAPASCLLEGR
jgi:dihydroxy-acid dehydratase